MTNIEPIHRRIIRRKQIPDRYGLPLSSFDRMVAMGVPPKGFKLGPPPTRSVGWYQHDLDAAFAQLAQAEQGR